MRVSSAVPSRAPRRLTARTTAVLIALAASTATGANGVAHADPVVGVTRPAPEQVAATPVTGVPAARPPAAEAPDAPSVSRVVVPPQTATVTLPTAAATALTVGSARVDVGRWQVVGSTGVGIAGVLGTGGSATSTSSRAVRASFPPTDSAAVRGLTGFTLDLAPADGRAATVVLRVPMAMVTGAAGADSVGRTRWITVPADRSDTTATATPAPARFDEASRSYLVAAAVSGAVTVAAVTGATSASGTGTFAASPLNPASTWDVSAQTGGFSTSYPLRVPPAPAGPAPQLALQYNSQLSDGETGATNNQPGVVGEGWELAGGGFIERSYVSCALEPGAGAVEKNVGDLCWRNDNATLDFAGHTGPLVRVGTTNRYRLQDDDGSRIEDLSGSNGCVNETTSDECWRLTTTDGVQYVFGKNQLPGWTSNSATPPTNSTWTVPVFGNNPGDPGYSGGDANFANESVVQAWRWNLDYVIDPHGNAEALYYKQQANRYAKDKSTGAGTHYIRGGTLDHIDYGLSSTNPYGVNAASARVGFGYAGRCTSASATACVATNHANWVNFPDTPWDQYCTTSCTSSQTTPTFWNDSRLATVTTSVNRGGTNPYAAVDTWTLSHSFPDPGDASTVKSPPALWLAKIVHSGSVGGTSITLPPTTFAFTQLQNRVADASGLASLNRLRIQTITNELGGVTGVNYAPKDCAAADVPGILASPQTNARRCFPQTWTPGIWPPSAPRKDVFHKYVVESVTSSPNTGGAADSSTATHYAYALPAWRYDKAPGTPDSLRTWSHYAGFATAEVDQGTTATRSATAYRFFQGLDGDHGRTTTQYVSGTVVDSAWLGGRIYKSKQLVVAGSTTQAYSTTIDTPAASAVTADDGTWQARYVDDGSVQTTQPTADGGTRTHTTITTYDFAAGVAGAYGLPVTVEDATSDAGTTCATTQYAPPNTTAWLIGLPQRNWTVDVACSQRTTVDAGHHVLTDTRSRYDAGTWGTSLTRGDLTEIQRATGHVTARAADGSPAATAWVRTALNGYDSRGRTTSVTDALGRATTTGYTATVGPVTGTTVVDPMGWSTTTTVDPAWGSATSVVDRNGHTTSTTYDALGRATATWAPDHPKSANTSTPNVSVSYTLDPARVKASYVTTNTLAGNGNVMTSYTITDGLGRTVQTQEPSEHGGTVYTDTHYDENGRTLQTVGPYYGTANPGGGIVTPNLTVERTTATSYDSLGRVTASSLYTNGSNPITTRTTYLGMDRVDTTPPTGGTPTSTYADSRGRTSKLTRWQSDTPGTGSHQDTTYTYDLRGDMTAMTDPAGNRWTWAFDDLGRLATAVDPDAGTTVTTYDDADRVTSTDHNGTVLAYTYDNADRKTAEYTGSATGPELASWTYDHTSTSRGLPDTSTRYVGSVAGTPGAAYTEQVTGYDAADRPTGTSTVIPTGPLAGTYTSATAYTLTGNVSTQDYPAMGTLPAEQLKYHYSTFDRPSGLTAGGVEYADSTAHDNLNRISMVVSYGDVELDRTYNYTRGTWRTMDQSSRLIVAANAVVSDDAYTYDNAGNVTSWASTQQTGSHTVNAPITTVTDRQCFTYGALQVLTQAWATANADCSAAPTAATLGGPAPYWTNYTVDPKTGNRTQTVQHTATGTSTDTYTYPAAGTPHPHAVSTVTHQQPDGTYTAASTYGYDDDGNTTARPGQTLTWTPDDHLAKVTKAGASASIVYDAAGNLLQTTDDTGSTLYLGDTELHVNAGSTTVTGTRTYSDGPLGLLGERVTKPGSTTTATYFSIPNIDGTSIVAVDTATGASVRRYQDPFGNPRGASPTWIDTHTYLNKPFSAFTGMAHLGARDYDPLIGRFASVDPVLAPQAPQHDNGYGYGLNNPLAPADPGGERPAGVDTTGCGAGAARGATAGVSELLQQACEQLKALIVVP